MKIALVNIPLNSEIGRVAKSLGFICLHHIDGDIIYNPHKNSLKDILSELNIDTLIWWGPEYNPLPKDFEKLTCYKVSVVGDWNLSFSYLKKVVGLFHIVVCDKYGVEIFNTHGFQNFSNWRGNGYNPDTFKNLNLERVYDITFAGTINNDIHRKREKFIYRLAKLSSKIKVNIVTAIYGNEYINLLNQSKLVFNFGIRREANMRLFESLACSALPLVEKDNMEIIDIFDQDEIAYYDENNFENVILELLENDEKRISLINKASLKIKKETYKAHLEWLLEIIIDSKNNINNKVYSQKNESSILGLLSILNSIGTYINKDELKIFIDNYDYKNLLDISSLNIYALIIANYSLIYENN
ncbi:MAG: glycosyltransferase, partial [Candidatus Sericytochromatia bacterium]